MLHTFEDMPLLKDYQAELRRFISGQHLNNGVRVTTSVLIPAWVLYHFGLLGTMVGVPLGALFVALTDNPGPAHHRRNGLLIAASLNFLVVLIAGVSRPFPVLVGIEIVVFGILFSIISIYGQRASSIGLTALVIFILSTNTLPAQAHVLQTGLHFLIGAVWYMLVSFSLNTLRPYRPVQQLLGECLMKTSAYLSGKGRFYTPEANDLKIISGLIEQQIEIHGYQEQLRSMLFTTRRFIAESTHKGRILTMMFRESIDLFERAVATHHDYRSLHRSFGDTGILTVFHRAINSMAMILYNIGLAVQEGTGHKDEEALEQITEEITGAFEKLRKEKLNAENVESFIKLRHVLFSLQHLAERIRKMMLYTTFEKELASEFKSDVDFSRFPTRQKINVSLFLSNISLKSSAFRHSLRLTLALVLGYLVALFFNLGHGYWILLTIATIIKPAYSLSKRRNIQRLAGTFVGVLIGFGLLFITKNDAVIFISMVVAMVTAYSLLKLNYAVSIGAITVYLLLSFRFLYVDGLDHFLVDRIVDTLIGCVIAYVVSYFILPSWEYQQIDKLIGKTVEKQRKYFNEVACIFTGSGFSATNYKMARKEAFVALANLSDSFQRMLSDPKVRQPKMPFYHQQVSACHLLASYIASLSDYAQRLGAHHASGDFRPIINIINRTFENFGQPGEAQPVEELESSPLYKRTSRLLQQRKKDLEAKGLEGTPIETRRTLGELVRITDQFRLVWATIREIVKIDREIREG